MRPTPLTRRPGALLPWLGAALAGATLLAFAVGQWAADARPARRAVASPAQVAAGTLPPEAPPVRAAPPPGWAPPPAARPPAAAALLGKPTAALVARVAEDAGRSLERARQALRDRCVPAGRPAGAGAPGRFTFNVTFDASGREIARGISEDRRARDPEVAACLRRLPLGSLRVPPPGASVGVRVALSLP